MVAENGVREVSICPWLNIVKVPIISGGKKHFINTFKWFSQWNPWKLEKSFCSTHFRKIVLWKTFLGISPWWCHKVHPQIPLLPCFSPVNIGNLQQMRKSKWSVFFAESCQQRAKRAVFSSSMGFFWDTILYVVHMLKWAPIRVLS